jgi:hypothetical protein
MTPAARALAEACLAASVTERDVPCVCEFADIGIGLQKVAEAADCPACTEFGFAVWARASGTDAEKAAARDYLAEWEAQARAVLAREAAGGQGD